jgi:membrane-bound lytic murein transglycosylase F
LRAGATFLRAGATFVCLLFLACGKAEQKAAPATPSPPAAAKSLEAKPPKDPVAEPIARDLPEITNDKTLRVLFTFNSTGYFVYRGETMGFEYDLLSRFARESKLRLVPVVVRDSTRIFEQLNRGEGDIVAAQIVASVRENEVLLTTGLYETSPVVVQRKAGDAGAGQPAAVSTALERERIETADPQKVEIRARAVATPAELGGLPVHMSRSSPYRRRLVELNEELSDDIIVVEVDDSTDRLIQRLSEGDIRFTVAAQNIASLKATEYSNLVIKPVIGPPQQVRWALRRNAPELQKALDGWLERQHKKGLRNILYKKYFQDRGGFARRAASRYLTEKTGTLSPYDNYFREYSKIPGWDWRLIASQSYQESRFNPNARSWAGAQGVMQIMPATARELRVNPRDPRQSIEGACRYLWKLDDRWKNVIKDEKERVKFILAAYNVGLGHVEDARRLAEKHGDDTMKWEDVAYWLIRKSKREVYNDPVVRYGFARGTEPVNYVESIIDRFEHYKAFVADPPTPPLVTRD